MTIKKVKPANHPIWGRWGGGWNYKFGLDISYPTIILYLGWWAWKFEVKS